MSYAGILGAIRDALWATMEPLGLRQVLDYEPGSVQAYPAVYLLLDSSAGALAGQMSARRWRIVARLVVARQDVRQDEPTVAALVDAPWRAIEADPTLGGAIARGLARVVEQKAIYVEIGGVVYRAVDTYIEAEEKVPYGA